jgi:hypothetical protein
VEEKCFENKAFDVGAEKVGERSHGGPLGQLSSRTEAPVLSEPRDQACAHFDAALHFAICKTFDVSRVSSAALNGSLTLLL